MELIVTGAPLDAARANTSDWSTAVVDDGQALTAALELAAQVAANAPMSVRASKAVAIESADWPLAEGFQRQRAYLEPVFASQDASEGVAAFRERRDPVLAGPMTRAGGQDPGPDQADVLAGKVAVITGGGRGFGKAFGQALAARGADGCWPTSTPPPPRRRRRRSWLTAGAHPARPATWPMRPQSRR